jgi:hypothetical protein
VTLAGQDLVDPGSPPLDQGQRLLEAGLEVQEHRAAWTVATFDFDMTTSGRVPLPGRAGRDGPEARAQHPHPEVIDPFQVW